jgi:hypothetical protein
MIASIDWDALWEVVWSSVVAGIGVTVIFGVAIVGVTRAVDLRRDGHGVASVVAGAVGIAALTVVAAAVVLGIVVMTNK